MHGYESPAADALWISRGACAGSWRPICSPISKWSPTRGVRSPMALVLEYIIRVGKPKTIVFSTFAQGLL